MKYLSVVMFIVGVLFVPTTLAASVNVHGTTMDCIYSGCMSADRCQGFWEYCPRAAPERPIIIPAWYVHGRKVCNEPVTGAFYCCSIGKPVQTGGSHGQPEGASCSGNTDCASGLCMLGICSGGTSSTSGFRMIPNAGIPGYNKKVLSRTTVDACKRYCLGTSWCKSIDFERSKGKCYVQNANRRDAKLKTNYGGNPYDHYEVIGR